MDENMNIQTASKYHHYLIVTIFLAVLTALFLRQFPVAQVTALLALWLFNVFCCYKLGSSFGKPALLWALVGLLGFFILCIPQLLLIDFANKVFKAAGLKIGFLGGAIRPL